jgi:hypothetical protein
MALDWVQIAAYLARARREARELAATTNATKVANAAKATAIAADTASAAALDAAVAKDTAAVAEETAVKSATKKRKRAESPTRENTHNAQQQKQHHAVAADVGVDAEHPWTAAECERVWAQVVYGDVSGDHASGMVAVGTAGKAGSTIPDGAGEGEAICKSIADPSTFYEEGWGECIAERQRALLEASFTVTGGDLFRRRNHALAFQLAKDEICGTGDGGDAVRASSSSLSPCRPSDYVLPLYITAHIPSRENQGLGLRIEEIDMGPRQAVVMGDPHPWSEANSGAMSSFERDERAKICPGMELLAINGGELSPATLERAVELVTSAESPVQLTLRFPPEDASFKLYAKEDECFSMEDRQRLKGYYPVEKRRRASATVDLDGRSSIMHS